MAKHPYVPVTTGKKKEKKTSSLAHWRFHIQYDMDDKVVGYAEFKKEVTAALNKKVENFKDHEDLSTFFNQALRNELGRIVWDTYHLDVIKALKKLNRSGIKKHDPQLDINAKIYGTGPTDDDDVFCCVNNIANEISIKIPSIGYTWIIGFNDGTVKLVLDPNTVKYTVPGNRVVQDIIKERDGKTEYVVNNMIQFLIQQFRNGKKAATFKNHEGYEDVALDTANLASMKADEEVNIAERCNLVLEEGPEGAIINPETSKCLSMSIKIDDKGLAVFPSESSFNSFVHLQQKLEDVAEFWWSANVDENTSVLVQSILNYKKGTLMHKVIRVKQAEDDKREIAFVGADVELHGFKAAPKVEEPEKVEDTESIPEPISESKVIEAEVVNEQHAE